MRNNTPQRKTESGAVFIEAAFSLPILLVFAFAMLDMGNWFMQHYALSRVVYEASRTGAGLGDLEEAPTSLPHYDSSRGNRHCIQEDISSAMSETMTFNATGHYVMMNRMQTLIQRQIQGRNAVLANQARAWTCFNSELKVVEAEISVPFESFLGHMFNVNGWMYRTDIWPEVTARATAPYLFPG